MSREVIYSLTSFKSDLKAGKGIHIENSHFIKCSEVYARTQSLNYFLLDKHNRAKPWALRRCDEVE